MRIGCIKGVTKVREDPGKEAGMPLPDRTHTHYVSDLWLCNMVHNDAAQ